ncbi:MAG: hypothetical protein WDM76_01625 [Limisphaerales bacterium]
MKAQVQNLRVKNLICLTLSLVTLALYLPALYHDFIEFDDQQYVTDNPRVQAGLTWNGLVWALWFSRWQLASVGLAVTHAGLPAFRGKCRWASSHQRFASHCQHATFIFGFNSNDRVHVAQCCRGSFVCMASSSCRIRGMGGGKKGCALCFFLDAHALVLCPVCR